MEAEKQRALSKRVISAALHRGFEEGEMKGHGMWQLGGLQCLYGIGFWGGGDNETKAGEKALNMESK